MNFKTLSVLFAALLVGGCATAKRDGLSSSQVTALENRSVSASKLGIKIMQTRDGDIVLQRVSQLTLGTEADVPLEKTDSVAPPTVKLTVNGLNAKAIIDTSSPITLTDFANAKKLKISPVGRPLVEIPAMTMGGIANTFLGIGRLLSQSDLQVYNIPVCILDDKRNLRAFDWMYGIVPNLVIGNDILTSFAHVRINVPRKRIQVSSAGRYRPNPVKLMAAVPFTLRNDVPIIQAFIDEIGPIDMAVASGGHYGLWIPRRIADGLELPELENGSGTKKAKGFNERIAYKHVDSRDVNIGGFNIEDLKTYVTINDLGEEELPYALLGDQIFAHFEVVFDYKEKRIYFLKP